MKSVIYSVLFSSVLAFSAAHAEKVVSGSKYPINYIIYKADAKCKPDENGVTSRVKGLMDTFEKSKGGLLDKFSASIGQALNTAIEGSGCERIGQPAVLKEGQSISAPIGSLIVAYKDPFAAQQDFKKTVNPLPAVCKVQAGKTISLDTRKSETLRGFIGMAGDGGLKCTFK